MRYARPLVVTLALAVVAALGVGLVLSKERSDVAPTEVLLENEHVRVQYHDVAPGETIPFHSHPATVVYALRPYKAKLMLPNGQGRVVEGPAGQAFWSDAVTHSVENVGDTPIHNLVIELKHLPAPEPSK